MRKPDISVVAVSVYEVPIQEHFVFKGSVVIRVLSTEHTEYHVAYFQKVQMSIKWCLTLRYRHVGKLKKTSKFYIM